MAERSYPDAFAHRHIRSEDFRDLDASERASQAIRTMDDLRQEGFIRDLKQSSYQLVGASGSAKVLDVGCGTGDDIAAIAQAMGRGGLAAGADLSKAMISEARHRHQDPAFPTEFVVADARSLPFQDNAFDAVRCERTLQHAEDPLAALREMARVTRPGGRIVVIDPDRGVSALDFDGWDVDVEFRLARWSASQGPVRNGVFSRQVRRHLLQMGFTNVVAQAWVNTSTEELQRRPHIIDENVERAAQAGVITLEEASIRSEAIREALSEGTLHITTLFWMTVGTKPE